MFLVNVLISSVMISFCSWLAQKRPELAGFIISLPLSTLLVLALNQVQYSEAGKGVLLAKSIFVAIPSTLVFFIPFLLSERLKLSFWTSYISGVSLLVVAFFVHRTVFSLLSK